MKREKQYYWVVGKVEGRIVVIGPYLNKTKAEYYTKCYKHYKISRPKVIGLPTKNDATAIFTIKENKLYRG